MKELTNEQMATIMFETMLKHEVVTENDRDSIVQQLAGDENQIGIESMRAVIDADRVLREVQS